jgi:uncharacterized protein (TIGR00296 family)
MGPHEKTPLDEGSSAGPPSTPRRLPSSAASDTAATTVTDDNEDTLVSSEMVATPSMCYHCFDTLIETLQHPSHLADSALRGSAPASAGHKRTNASTAVPDFWSDLPDPTVECPLFVTWDKQPATTHDDSSSWTLRGCIGTLSPKVLSTAVGDYAIMSALRDRRFRPVTLQEVSSLRVSVSLLVQYEECRDAYDWEVGKHGILIKFTSMDDDDDGHPRHYNATYLPEVAKQQHWDHAQTVSSLIRKAGFTGIIDDHLLKRIHCTRYQSSKCQVTFPEYVLHNCEGNDPIPPTHKSRTSSWVSPCISM